MALVAKPLLVPLNDAIMEVKDKQSHENLENGEIPTIDRQRFTEIADMLDLLGDMFKKFHNFP